MTADLATNSNFTLLGKWERGMEREVRPWPAYKTRVDADREFIN